MADLALVQVGQLVAGRPWRVFRWRQGQAHYSGWYWSATTGGHVVYESRLELARLLMADFDPQVTAIAAQPFLVAAPSRGRTRRHVPDFLLIGRDGGVRVVNVKPAVQLEVPKVAEALAWAGEVFAARGWQHEIWSGTAPVLLANVRFLAGYRYADRVDATLVAAIMQQVPGAASIGELEDAWPGRAGEARAAVLHLVWQGVFRTDLSVPLSAATRLERAS
ncbi:MAG TPA: TnsA-like heteromeric transposase endonuclease subunit [Streptosporangiaceae bacterium]|nr:TnsA-like heteromeric transposase endonuclease subunit [Streptosporangiaceae bacterium]